MRKLGFCLIALLASMANATTIEMKVYGLVCGFCAQGIEKTLRKNPRMNSSVVATLRGRRTLRN